MIVVGSLVFDLLAAVVKGQEPVHVQTFVPE